MSSLLNIEFFLSLSRSVLKICAGSPARGFIKSDEKFFSTAGSAKIDKNDLRGYVYEEQVGLYLIINVIFRDAVWISFWQKHGSAKR